MSYFVTFVQRVTCRIPWFHFWETKRYYTDSACNLSPRPMFSDWVITNHEANELLLSMTSSSERNWGGNAVHFCGQVPPSVCLVFVWQFSLNQSYWRISFEWRLDCFGTKHSALPTTNTCDENGRNHSTMGLKMLSLALKTSCRWNSRSIAFCNVPTWHIMQWPY